MFLGILLHTLGVSLLRNISSGKRLIEGGDGVIHVGPDF